ncbi:hypothetical protein PY365_15465 [Roseiarcaceae bacterium H3SJ34-1]|uniref:hypothetical protein n=1 Tax=Terripilifer ovatus TaxID=3032367 RepID=UPI003AB932E9|nr:hypothetical protein [Roseiarcaceae bacterium H3SJ34-1]
MQSKAGMAVFTDGEMRRDSQRGGRRFRGYLSGEMMPLDGTRLSLRMHTKAICGKLKQQRRLAQSDAYFL